MKKIFLLFLLMITNLFSYKIGDTIPDELAKHIGVIDNKVYVVDFFASWCGSCKKELPLISVANTKIDSNKAEIIGIDVDKDVNKGVSFQEALKEKKQLNFKVINDPQNMIIKEFKPIGMPTLYYIKNKKIVKILTGAVDDIDNVVLEDIKTISEQK